ncbi:arsenate reductase (glutaredoxin) [Brevundimonas sp. Root1423]|uniref:arsenate reductase (glutaredoxin) n=1 Tax=Brevundimonas sp. Root1423 TaxID=1736462 RepID=UPI0006F985BA|nr:arsenate reductase (glutaredoxin) [Brevundimonas sp. Root1423]KQY80510.1 arsenate reductase [Brevundimonas sp. Root1423]
MTDFPVTVFHNPACGTSRKVLGMIEAAGYQPDVVEYLQTGWTSDQLHDLFAEAGLTPRDALRENEAAVTVPALLDAAATDDAILEAMLADPVLVNRPIVRTPRGAALCRPPERVLDLLDRRPDDLVDKDADLVEPGQAISGAPSVGPA